MQDPRPPVSPRVMALSAMGLKLESSGFANHTHKNKRNTDESIMFVHRVAFYAGLSSR